VAIAGNDLYHAACSLPATLMFSPHTSAISVFTSGLLNAIDLRQKTNATFVGEATGGKPNHFGEVGNFRLPNSRLQVNYAKRFSTPSPAIRHRSSPIQPSNCLHLIFSAGAIRFWKTS
jgi:hypothetical protein